MQTAVAEIDRATRLRDSSANMFENKPPGKAVTTNMPIATAIG